MVWLLYEGTTGRPRVVSTADIYAGTGAGLRHRQYAYETVPVEPILLHTDYLIESVYIPVYPLSIPITHSNPMSITLFNNEAFNISWDLTFWILETSLDIFKQEVIPFMRGYIDFFQGQDKQGQDKQGR